MKILIAASQRMEHRPDLLDHAGQPPFFADALRLTRGFGRKNMEERLAMWRCSPRIAKQASAYLAQWEDRHLHQDVTPAVLAFTGTVYGELAADVATEAELVYLEEHLVIVSGLYGILRPLDGIAPYRLEMEAKRPLPEIPDLYAYWGDRLGAWLDREDVLINLAPAAYAKAILPYVGVDTQIVSCRFFEGEPGKLMNKTLYTKQARGQMVRFLARTSASCPQQMQRFSENGYSFVPALSSMSEYVFVRRGNKEQENAGEKLRSSPAQRSNASGA